MARDGDRRRAAAASDLAESVQRDARVEVVAYDPDWSRRFADERERLAPVLGEAEVHHVGSTAVPGLAAKPVIDVMALVEDLDAPIDPLVERLGYRFPAAFNATLTDRRWLCRPSAAHRTHHLHLVATRELLDRHLRFRDRLRADAALRDRYAALKRDLAARHPDDRERYTEGKSAFVAEALGEGAAAEGA